ncbi:hypothetical protein LER48_31070 [Pseudomonas aeruginosa]|jgi:hypothetical protein|uniref:hypothetical protein n=1 Tax=Pseudomonas TaxID=286 RepID=UPI000FFE6FAE|nr:MULTISPECIES: hypothetical protein [Pseudomonas]MBA5207982.1 hypothetical protein [Pseudomonas aeruginosa]MBM9966502.1 hypothetical protein [Pseudomonas aeruginosa]MBN0096896.1 hypothetical protein [Pseudomonas aeruginosa]MBN0272121.1 hypothetical protein [Pseudomonas aeruginosa]MBN0572415.1 hypothetical protein [Pseudomonas aeruginosa]
MSQPFVCMLSVTGESRDVAEVAAHFENEWREMGRDNTVLRGFSWVQSTFPEKVNSAEGSMTWRFSADGRRPEVYAVVLSQAFPKVRVHLAAADRSPAEWLAVAIAAQNGKFENIDQKNQDMRRYKSSADMARDLLIRAENLRISSR